MADPYRQKILEGLDGALNREVFEECVVGLLSPDLPVVPVRGGSDAGMDGAIADGRGEPFPLVVTTAKDVIGNLTRSLDSYRDHGFKRRRVALATSRALTPLRQRNLYQRARDKGFLLVALYERQAIADRLYRNSGWTKQLLGLSGKPRALSALPRTRRPLVEIPLIGRDADLEWLSSGDGDRVLVGQPGSGKTYLLLQLVRQGRGLFLVRDDDEAIAHACRDLKPELIFVDDAHVDPESLDRLRHLRTEVEGDFKIIATTWPGSTDEVANALAVSTSQVRQLELLTRKQIVEVLRAIGIEKSVHDPFLRFLVNESANKPGLAVVLGSLLLRGELQELFSGEALQRTLIPTLERIVGVDLTDLLACYALGGTRGQPMESVRAYLGLSRHQIFQHTVEASHGGVVTERGESIVVLSELLRSALIHEVFFSSSHPKLPYQDLLETAPSLKAATDALVHAVRRGAAVPEDELRGLLADAGSAEAWALYAGRDEAAARWVVDHYPSKLADIAPAVLSTAPEPAISALLHAASSAIEPLHSRSGHPLGALREWLQEIPDRYRFSNPFEESLRRRELLVEVAQQSLRDDDSIRGSVEVACILALLPNLEGTKDSVTGESVTLQRGILPATGVPRVLALWRRVLQVLGTPPEQTWKHLADVLHRWTYPTALGNKRSNEDVEKYRDVARQIVQDLAPFAEGRPGLALALEDQAERVGLALELEVNEEFRTLFPRESRAGNVDWRERRAREQDEARKLAQRCVEQSPRTVARRLVSFDLEAAPFVGAISGLYTRLAFYTELASSVPDPGYWSTILMEEGLDPQWLSPFIERAVSASPEPDELLRRCLADERYRWLGAGAALRSEKVSDVILETALQVIPAQGVVASVSTGDVPVGTMIRLLRHPDEAIRISAVIGRWQDEGRESVDPEIDSVWLEALMRIGEETAADNLDKPVWGHGLRTILEGDRDLALRWLRVRITGAEEFELVDEDGLYAAAIRSLDTDARRQLLELLAPGNLADHLVILLVDSSPELFEHLLRQTRLREHHLRPLGGRVPDADFVKLAALALEHGQDPQDIAAESFLSVFGGGFSGSGVEHWGEWKRGFDWMLQSTDGGLMRVAEHGLQQADSLIGRARAEERRRELEGW